MKAPGTEELDHRSGVTEWMYRCMEVQVVHEEKKHRVQDLL